MKSVVLVALLVACVSGNTLRQNFYSPDPRTWLPEDAPVLEPSDSESPAESSPIPSAYASESVTAASTSDKLQSSALTDVLSGTSPLAASSGEKPEAFLIHFKPKTGQTSKSKYMLLLKLPDGSTETIESNSETLAPEASQPEKSVPSVEESTRNIQQTTQNQFDDELGFDDDSQNDGARGGSAASAGASAGNRFSSSSAAAAAAAGGSVTASVSAGGAVATIEQQLQSDDDQQQRDIDRPQRGGSQDSQQQLSDDDLQQQQQPADDQGLDQQIVEQDRDGGSSAFADPNAGGYGQQMNLLSGLTNSPNAGAVYTSYAGTADQRVPVILIALPPRASAQSQRQTLNRLLGALRNPAAPQAPAAGTKGRAPASPSGARKGGSQRQGKTSLPASPAAGTKGRPAPAGPVAQEPLPGGVKGGSVGGSLRILGPLSPVAQLAAKGGSGLRVKGTRGQGNTNSPDNPQPRHPTGGFGGYGNSHTPSPSGGYGSLSMRLAAKGIPLPTERDVQRPQSLRAILSLARQTNAVNSQAGQKSARLSVRTY